MVSQTVKLHDSGTISLKDIRAVIPPHCFECSATRSLLYIVRDLAICSSLFYLSTWFPAIQWTVPRQLCWLVYGIVQGMVFTGIWIEAHECGHQALFKHQTTNDGIGLFLHSFLLVPYFSWKFSHARHHMYTNHMEKDTAFVPSKETDSRILTRVVNFFHVSEDTPLLNLGLLILHQLVGWPLYLFFHITAGTESGAQSRAKSSSWARLDNHFNPLSAFFSPAQSLYILISDLGLLTMALLLRQAALVHGAKFVFLAYGIPYLWVNHWLVAITYLHHNHQEIEHFGEGAWSFQKGALSTVDREFGFVGRKLFHGIIEFHVVHHLFSKIPFYHAEEATEAMKPLLGDRYIHDQTSFLQSLWRVFVSLQYVKPREKDSAVYVWAQESPKKTKTKM